MFYLYYAGMAKDGETEQIGLAISQDGKSFQRANGDGLIMRRDSSLIWKNLRVCNPTVLTSGNKFVMFYQGISARPPLNTALGYAASDDGIQWRCDERPVLSVDDMKGIDLDMDKSARTGLIEPSVIREGDSYKMWFIYMNPSHPGNGLFYAESRDGRTWKVRGQRVLAGGQFGDCNLHYPQVVQRAGGYDLYFSLKNNINHVFGSFKMSSRDGFLWDRLEQLLPETQSGFCLEPRGWLQLKMNSRKIPGVGFLNYRLALHLGTKTNRYFGYAHPHHLSDSGTTRLYYHGVNAGPSRSWYDVGLCEIIDGKLANQGSVFAPSPNPDAWDCRFVADPFVLKVVR